MLSFDMQYKQLVDRILTHGYEAEDRTGTGILKVFGAMIHLENTTEHFPILECKKVPFASLRDELRWIYQDQSNDVRLLREKYGVTIWDEWERPDGTIGDAYGEQVRKHAQIDRLIKGLREDPQGRRHMMSLWSWEDLENMALPPCCFQTIWDVNDGKLNVHVTQRSADVGLGLPFNVSQYCLLQHMIAHVVGLEVGEYLHVITNAHIYKNHVEPLEEIFVRPSKGTNPKLYLNPYIRDFYRFQDNDIRLVGYDPHPHIKMEVSV